MRRSEFFARAAVAARRRVPGGRRVQRSLRHEDLRDLRRLDPVSSAFGFDRGLPVDRFYIEQFLSANADAIRGRVLEVGDDRYTRQFGRGVEASDVLHPIAGRGITLVGDLETGAHLPSEAFDCVIATQTLNSIFDLAAVATHLRQILRPGGVLLVTVPGISQITEFDMARWGDFWRFTPTALERLLTRAFESVIECRSFGNVLSSAAFLYGLAAEELEPEELAHDDPRYPLVVTARAERGALLSD
jgi:SAM-dependent methyltransferase